MQSDEQVVFVFFSVFSTASLPLSVHQMCNRNRLDYDLLLD